MKISAPDLAGIRAAYEDEMGDTCVVLAYSETQDAVGAVVPGYAAGAALACLFSPVSSAEQHRADGTLAVVVARLRLPVGTAITRRDRVQLTQRFGVDLASPLTYEIEGAPYETLGFLHCDLREVTT